jgi:hypothetical protein
MNQSGEHHADAAGPNASDTATCGEAAGAPGSLSYKDQLLKPSDETDELSHPAETPQPKVMISIRQGGPIHIGVCLGITMP